MMVACPGNGRLWDYQTPVVINVTSGAHFERVPDAEKGGHGIFLHHLQNTNDFVAFGKRASSQGKYKNKFDGVHAGVVYNHPSVGRALVTFDHIIPFAEYPERHVPKQVVNCIQCCEE